MKSRIPWVLLLGLVGANLIANGHSAESPSDASYHWLDPSKKIYVLQNRKYQKANHLTVSGLLGLGMTNPYRNVINFDGRLAFYFTEDWGVEAFGITSLFNSNNNYLALQEASPAAFPRVREIRSQAGALAHWSAWYAKINFFNQILYFDWLVQMGFGGLFTQLDINNRVGGKATYIPQNFPAFFWGTGQQFHLSQSWVIRLDFLGSIYRAQLFGNKGGSAWFSNYQFDAGVGFRL